MENKFVLLTNDCSDYTNMDSKDVETVSGGLKPISSKIKWYTPPSDTPEYYSKWQEYDRMDLTDGKSNNDEVLEDGKYNPGTRYVMYGSLKDTTVMIRPSMYKDVLVNVNSMIKNQILPDDIVRQLVARQVAEKMEKPSVKNVICQIEDLSDVIVLEDIFAVMDSVDSIEHDILKNEIKLYVFDPYKIEHATEDKKYKVYIDIKNRVEKGFYKKKLEFLDMIRWDKTLEPKDRNSYLKCGVMINNGETSEQCYDRVKPYLEQLYRDFERYKDNYEEFKMKMFSKIKRPVLTERNEWDERYNDEAITEGMVQGLVRFFSGIYISADAEKNICYSLDRRRRFRYNRSFQVTTLGIFNSDALELEKVIDVEELREKNIEEKRKEEQENIR